MNNIADAARCEVEEIHRHFVELFTGRSTDVERCARVFAADFQMVTPTGLMLDRTAAIALLSAAKARSDFQISIQALRTIRECDNSVLLQYVEQQYREGRTTRRLSSALFTTDPGAPCGVVWRYLQETWLQDT